MNKLLFDLNDLPEIIRDKGPLWMQYPCGRRIDLGNFFRRRTRGAQIDLYISLLMTVKRRLENEECIHCGEINYLSKMTDEEFLDDWDNTSYGMRECPALKNYIENRISELTS